MAPKTAEAYGFTEVEVDFVMLPVAMIFVAGDYRNLPAYAQERFGHPVSDSVFPNASRTEAVTLCEADEPPIVWMKSIPQTPSEVATLCHEVFHAVGHIFDHFGIPTETVPPCRGEVFAYALEFGVREILKGLESARGKIRRRVKRRV